mmetsp:Transcript_3891/g.10277  ORF Transcript_3891/g.10277 Transcript_3891/m.10277 type:complete len:263 (-) Transcript_3891:220-1008(-)
MLATRNFIKNIKCIIPLLDLCTSTLWVVGLCWALVVGQREQPFHHLILDVMERHAALRAMLLAFSDVDGVLGVPVLRLGHVLRQPVVQVMSRQERHVSLRSLLILRVVRVDVELPQDPGHHRVLREGHLVGEVPWKSLHDQRLQCRLVHGVSRPTGNEDVVPVAAVRKSPAQEQRRLHLRVAVFIRQVLPAICGRADLLALQVQAQILHHEEEIVAADVEPVVLFVVVVVNVTPHRSYLLPDIVVCRQANEFVGASLVCCAL